MKKIIALALCLIMALSLCTVAFAKTTSSSSEGSTVSSVEGYYVRPMQDNNNSNKVTVDKVGTAAWSKETIDDETVTLWTPECYIAGTTTYYACDESLAEVRVFNKSGFVGYAFTPISDIKAPEGKFIAKGKACLDYVKDTVEFTSYSIMAANTFVDYTFIVADEDTGAYVYAGGKLYSYVIDPLQPATFNKHQFSIDDVTFKGTDKDGHMVPVSVKCSECGKTFQIITKTKLAGYEGKYEPVKFNNSRNTTYADFTGFGEGTDGYSIGTIINIPDSFTTSADLKDELDTYYVLLGVDGKTVTTTTATADGVESAKTFDAGVAMYVGMSLSAVAGSAVVIGKKKEF